jgi:predicted metal-dependent hydrolase
VSKNPKIITLQGHSIELERKRIKNINLAVYPATGRIRVSVPEHMDEERVRQFLQSKLSWIEKQLAKVKPETIQSYESGSTHQLEGKSFILNLILDASSNRIQLQEGRIDLYLKPGRSSEHVAKLLQEWYRSRLKARVQPLMNKWQRILGVQVSAWNIKQMKTKWGSCNTRDKRIWLNLELAKKCDEYLEYVIVHELVHLLERGHNARFYGLLDKYLPDWRQRKALGAGS